MNFQKKKNYFLDEEPFAYEPELSHIEFDSTSSTDRRCLMPGNRSSNAGFLKSFESVFLNEKLFSIQEEQENNNGFLAPNKHKIYQTENPSKSESIKKNLEEKMNYVKSPLKATCNNFFHLNQLENPKIFKNQTFSDKDTLIYPYDEETINNGGHYETFDSIFRKSFSCIENVSPVIIKRQTTINRNKVFQEIKSLPKKLNKPIYSSTPFPETTSRPSNYFSKEENKKCMPILENLHKRNLFKKTDDYSKATVKYFQSNCVPKRVDGASKAKKVDFCSLKNNLPSTNMNHFTKNFELQNKNQIPILKKMPSKSMGSIPVKTVKELNRQRRKEPNSEPIINHLPRNEIYPVSIKSYTDAVLNKLNVNPQPLASNRNKFLKNPKIPLLKSDLVMDLHKPRKQYFSAQNLINFSNKIDLTKQATIKKHQKNQNFSNSLHKNNFFLFKPSSEIDQRRILSIIKKQKYLPKMVLKSNQNVNFSKMKKVSNKPSMGDIHLMSSPQKQSVSNNKPLMVSSNYTSNSGNNFNKINPFLYSQKCVYPFYDNPNRSNQAPRNYVFYKNHNKPNLINRASYNQNSLFPGQVYRNYQSIINPSYKNNIYQSIRSH
jgi:hypothetical protein